MLSCFGQNARFLCIALLLIAAKIHGQNNDTISITIQVSNIALNEAMKLITDQSGLSFSYNTKNIETDKKLSLSLTNATIKQVLGQLEEQTGYRFTLVERQIIIKPPKGSNRDQVKQFTISGYISDSTNGEALIGTTIYIKELKSGTVANAYGFYSLTLPEHDYSIEYSFIGFETIRRNVSLNSNVNIDIEFKSAVPLLPEVIVRGIKPKAIEEIQTSKTYIRPSEISEIPSLMGELDVIKGLQTIPGIKMHSDGSTFFSVRGGAKDQNLILIDEAPIYNPSHLLGLFSTVVPEAINDLTIYKGDFPVSHGGRLSSLIDIKTNEGNLKNLEIWGSIGLISTKLAIEAPIKKEISSFFIAARRSHLKFLYELDNNTVDKLQFYDVTGKMNFKLNKKNKLFFSFYTGKDTFINKNSGISWSNTTGTVRWNHLFSDRMFSNTTFYASNYDYFLFTNVELNDRWNSHVQNVNLKSDFTWFIKPENLVTFGLSFGGYNFNPGNFELGDTIRNNPAPAVSQKNAGEFILYAGEELKLNDHWGIKYGLRFTSWTNRGEAFEFEYDDQGQPVINNQGQPVRNDYVNGEKYNTYISLEPRLNISYFINDKSSLKASYNRVVQNVHLISNSISPFTTLDVWLPSSTNIKPQSSDQLTLGYSRFFDKSGVSFELEGYMKYLHKQIEYKDHAIMLLNPFFESQLLFGNAKAYGIETMLKKDLGRLRGWLGYTYSHVRHRFDNINSGKVYPGFYDRPHQVNVVLSYDITLRVQMGLSWLYYSGAPFSSPTGFYFFDNQELPIYGNKNNDRFPDYHRLDLSADFVLNKNPKKFKHSISISLYNLYGQKNPVFINFNKTRIKDVGVIIPGNLFGAFRLPTQTIYYTFIPSIAYNFKFQ